MHYLTEHNINEFIKLAFAEDVGSGDHSSLACIPANAKGKAKLIVKDKGILAGIELTTHICKYVQPSLGIEVFIQDGTFVKSGDVAFHIYGHIQSILKAERLILNCMQRMSGIATITNKFISLIKHTPAKLLDTRKTTPNFRLPEKWAVKIGGGENHRYGLYDMIMLKDNHIDYAGGIRNAIEAADAYIKANNLDLKIEIETRNIEEVKQVLDTGKVHRILLDNMTPAQISAAVQLINKTYETEASGGINEYNVCEVAETGVDYISVGALTHSAHALDMSLKAF
ncbi:MAG: carboxylating nicotinate-nucleotide diphosphorylase [Cytophagaceae bacterium]|nr:carboxylating nicotinate-nucleotide diphosphorylase [Cytophagaceae bacterium]MDW8457372.1 carboxylating nicotinate-nucleotide diphosphorylase [Cytophagaceae bacterium]